MTARIDDPDTSHEAAALIEEHIPRIQWQILKALRGHSLGLTTREMVPILATDFATISPRMRPMEEKGWVLMTPVKRQNPTGKGWGHVWEITSVGRGVIA